VFGLNRRTVESLDATAENQRYELEAAYLTLTSNLALAAVQEASLRAQIAATNKLIDIEEKSVKLLLAQKGLGANPEQDVLAQEATLAAVQATLPPLQKSLAQQRDLIASLIGAYPSELLPETFALAALHLPGTLPVSLPSRLVRQRPDILAAEENWRSANADVGVAIANRLPQITLTATPGSSALTLASLFNPANGFMELSGTVAQTVFDGFTLEHKQYAAEAGATEAESQYRQTVVTAFQNVADSLWAVRSDADALKTAVYVEEKAKASLDIATAQQHLGAITTLDLLTAEETYFEALLNRVQAEAARLSDAAALFQALGGGWWNRPDANFETQEASK
jgi:NodT family efflux transporter outer membrane factor (OMF) lipoprotein